MARYKLQIKRSAAKELEAVAQKGDRQRLVVRIEVLRTDPRPPGCEKLTGGADRYRVRQGDYRVVYSVDDANRVVLVVKIGHRREVYR
ncbi:MAG: type II toxin-antitoxin system RelE/ParE family toxin [Deltaproteobacteria bacterium]|nr:type II toxin-antitoxin system RelE/ParE family toxin [Deltaproteobacteria bacterium]